MFGLLMVLYGIGRFTIDFFRYYETNARVLFGLSFNQVISVALIGLGRSSSCAKEEARDGVASGVGWWGWVSSARSRSACSIFSSMNAVMHVMRATSAHDSAAASPLAGPVTVARFPLRLTTRVLCARCAERSCGGPDPSVSTTRCGSIPRSSRTSVLLAVIHLMKFGRRECLAPWLAGAMTSALPDLRSE
jgi:hypothetical protein